MEDLSLHVLDVTENALSAGASRIDVRIVEMTQEDLMELEIEDNGCGMDEQAAKRSLDPFCTTKPDKRVGLGLPLLSQAAEEAGGRMEIRTAPGEGTVVCATFQLSHPDLKPLGDMLRSVALLACAHPHVQFTFEHRRDGVVIASWNGEPASPEGYDHGEVHHQRKNH